MKKLAVKKLILTAMVSMCIAAPAFAQESDKAKKWSQSEMERMMAEFLMNNPQILLDSVDQYAKAQAEEAQARADVLIRDNADTLFNNANLPVIGNPKGDVTVVEFVDYNCGYCKKAMDDVMTLIGEDNNIRVIMVDIPILGEASTEAAKWALAAAKQDKYLDYHVALMDFSGRLNAAEMAVIAARLGLDVDQLRKDKDSQAVQAQIANNIELARRLGIRGTPAFVVGERLVRGYVGLDALRQGVSEARNGDTQG